MLTVYIAKMMHQAKYKLLDDGTYFGEIRGLSGVWASAKTLDTCRDELQSVLEDWLVLKIRSGESVRGLALRTRTKKSAQYA